MPLKRSGALSPRRYGESMKLFDWLPGVQKKESAVGGIVSGYQVGRPVYEDKAGASRDQYAAEAMKAVVAYRAIMIVAKSFAAVQWFPARKINGEFEEVENADIERLWSRPNPMQSGAQFREDWATLYSIHGEGPVERVLAREMPRELYNHKPERVSPIPGRTGIPAAYEYKYGGKAKRFDVDAVSGDCNLRFIRASNPVGDWRGLAPTAVAGIDIDAYNASRTWNAALLQNSARPSGILKTQEVLQEDQRDTLKAAIEEKYSGQGNAGRPMVLEGGLDWQQVAMSPAEMEWIEGNRETARAIAMAYGVPPMLLGIPGDNTYANYREARLALYDDTIIPLLRLYADEINAWLMPFYGEDVCIVPDIDAIEALQYRMESKVAALRDASCLTINEKRAALGYPPLDEGGDIVPDVANYTGLPLDLDGGEDYGA